VALFQEGSEEKRRVVELLAQHLVGITEPQLISLRAQMASKLEGEQREAFLRAFPSAAKMAVIDINMRINLAETKEGDHGQARV
jgi:hypothetical protein